VQDAPPLLHVPRVKHCAALVHAFCDHGWPFCLLQFPGVVAHCALDMQPLPPCAQVPPLSGQVALEKHDAAAWQTPVPMPVQLAFDVQGVTLSGQTLWLQLPGVQADGSPDGHACLAPVLQ